jgi:hypothetical protein
MPESLAFRPQGFSAKAQGKGVYCSQPSALPLNMRKSSRKAGCIGLLEWLPEASGSAPVCTGAERTLIAPRLAARSFWREREERQALHCAVSAGTKPGGREHRTGLRTSSARRTPLPGYSHVLFGTLYRRRKAQGALVACLALSN